MIKVSTFRQTSNLFFRVHMAVERLRHCQRYLSFSLSVQQSFNTSRELPRNVGLGPMSGAKLLSVEPKTFSNTGP